MRQRFECNHGFKYNNSLRGMSLVELAIVLVIIGIMAGGVIAGQEMIHAAELRKIPLAIEDTRKSIMVFYDKYDSLPGDTDLAEELWGADCVGCNGNYNGWVGANKGQSGIDNFPEFFRFWQHLQLAGLAEGDFSGVTGPDSPSHVLVNENIPEIYDNIGLHAFWLQNVIVDNHADLNTGEYGQIFIIGRRSWGWLNREIALTTEDAFNIDTKIDDGKPFTGILYGNGASNAFGYQLCTTAAAGDSDDFDAEYDLNVDGPACIFFARNVFPVQQ